MQRQQPGGTFDEMAAWLLELERRLRVLEAENQELRRQLTDLRRGVGIALVIEGRTVPVAPLSPISAPTGPMPAVAPPIQPAIPHAQGFATPPAAAWPGPEQANRAAAPPQPSAGRPSFGPLSSPANAPNALARSWPGVSGPTDPALLSDPYLPAQHESAPTHPRADQRPSWPPAATTAHLPVVRPLSAPLNGETRSDSHAAWLRSGGQWPNPASGRPSYPATYPQAPAAPASLPPLAPLGPDPTARPGEPNPREQAQRDWQPGERNPFADSFIL